MPVMLKAYAFIYLINFNFFEMRYCYAVQSDLKVTA